MARRNNPALFRIIVLYIFFISANFLVAFAWTKSIPFIICSQLFYAILVCSIFASLHELVHATAFKSKVFNRLFSLVNGFFHIYPPSLFKDLHFTHHRYTHIEGKDPEISLGNRPIPSVLRNLSSYISWITGLPVFVFKVLMLISGVLGMPELFRKNLFPFVKKKNRGIIFIECLVFLIGYALLIYLILRLGFHPISILIGQITGHCLLSIYLTMEHNGLPHEGNILEKTRSIRTNKLIKTIMWNMPYHAEHHAYPGVPFHTLPALHEAIKSELKHKDESHLDFHLSTFLSYFKSNKRGN